MAAGRDVGLAVCPGGKLGGYYMKDNGVSAGIYGMGFIGAAIYFIGHAGTFWLGVLGFFKAIFWPAVLIYKLLETLGL